MTSPFNLLFKLTAVCFSLLAVNSGPDCWTEKDTHCAAAGRRRSQASEIWLVTQTSHNTTPETSMEAHTCLSYCMRLSHFVFLISCHGNCYLGKDNIYVQCLCRVSSTYPSVGLFFGHDTPCIWMSWHVSFICITDYQCVYLWSSHFSLAFPE